jgi:RHS repeat-associated protein
VRTNKGKINKHLENQRPQSSVPKVPTSYYHADGLGSIVALTDSSGKVQQTYEYDSFGNLKDQKNKIKQPFTFTGREWDKEAGLYYYRARYYDTIAGRFISKDPIGFRGGINLYAYVDSVGEPSVDTNLYAYTGNNPVNLVDELGLQEHPLIGMSRSPYYWYYQPAPHVKPLAQFSICEAKCMAWGYTAPVTFKLGEEGLTHLMKHHPKSPKWLKWGGKKLGWIGWGIFAYEAFECAEKCGEADNKYECIGKK